MQMKTHHHDVVFQSHRVKLDSNSPLEVRQAFLDLAD